MEAGLASLLGTGWASGVNLYGTVLLLGIFGRLELAPVPEVLMSWPVIGLAALFYLIELVADKVPYVDNVWDVAHTAIRPIGAAVVGGLMAGEVDVSALLGATSSGGVALASHATKATSRLAINASPEPVSNIGVSFFEDGLVAFMVWLAAENPVLAGGLALALVVLGVASIVLLWKAIRRGIRRLRDRRRDIPDGPSVRPVGG